MIEKIIEVQKEYPYQDGWVFVRVTNTQAILRHPTLGERIIYIGAL